MQRLEIVNLPIEDNPDRAIFVRERLMAAGEIDNAETVEAEPDVAVQVESVIVRSAMAGAWRIRSMTDASTRRSRSK